MLELVSALPSATGSHEAVQLYFSLVLEVLDLHHSVVVGLVPVVSLLVVRGQGSLLLRVFAHDHLLVVILASQLSYQHWFSELQLILSI